MLVTCAVSALSAETAPELTLHVILQSHLDPVWLWNREQGIDAALATARTSCDLMDDFPEVHVTRGEAWIYSCCEKYDPETFRRLKAHVAAGRLHVVGGEYVQSDCNIPAGDAFADQLAFATRYFRERVGAPPILTGYNPDSFGHGAYLPRFLSDAGMRNYLFMRPGPHEKSLPGEVFRWRSPDGAEVLAARIDGCYNPLAEDGVMLWQVTNNIAHCDRSLGLGLTMIGIGDHGGGPARMQVEWLLKHRNDWPGVKIVFSHPDAFFDAVRATGKELPVVTGELQHHAIGCYTALSRIKREVRDAEDALRRDGDLLAPDVRDECRAHLAFATFHDILGGCSIASAYPDIYDTLAHVRTLCREARIAQTRRRNARLPPTPLQRVIFDNPGKGRWRGVIEFEAWLRSQDGWYSWYPPMNETLCLRDADGGYVPVQLVPQRDKSERTQPNLALAVDLQPGETRTYYVAYDKTEAEGARYHAPLQAGAEPRWRFEVVKDESDTWSHGIKDYPAAMRTMKRTGEDRTLAEGPYLLERVCQFDDPSGQAFVRVRHERGLPGVRLKARVVWSRPRELVKLAIEPGFAVTGRIDRVAGGDVVRALDGEEWPFAGAVTLLGADGRRLSVVTRDATALDVQPDGTVRLTLLRTPPYAEQEDPTRVGDVSWPVTDLGDHFFDIQVLDGASPELVDDVLYALSSPLVFSETTKGVGKK